MKALLTRGHRSPPKNGFLSKVVSSLQSKSPAIHTHLNTPVTMTRSNYVIESTKLSIMKGQVKEIIIESMGNEEKLPAREKIEQLCSLIRLASLSLLKTAHHLLLFSLVTTSSIPFFLFYLSSTVFPDFHPFISSSLPFLYFSSFIFS